MVVIVVSVIVKFLFTWKKRGKSKKKQEEFCPKDQQQ